MQCRIESADRTYFDGETSILIAQSPRGEFAVMNDHAPLLANLRNGPLRVKTSAGEHVFACFGGTLRVAQDGITVLVEDAVPVEEIDLGEIQRDLSETDEAIADEAQRLQRRKRLLLLQRIKEDHG